MDFARMILDALGVPKPGPGYIPASQQQSPGLLGGSSAGGVQGAAQAMANRAYQLHLQEAAALGQQPLPYPVWAAQQK